MWSLIRVLGAFFVVIPSFLSLLICLHDVIMLDKVICTFAMKLIMLTLGTRVGRSTIVLHKEKKDPGGISCYIQQFV